MFPHAFPAGFSFSLSHLARFGAIILLTMLAACDSIEERVASHYERGQELVDAGSPEKAVLEFNNALQLDDKHVPSHFAIAKIQEAGGELQQAFARYGKVVELDPNHAEARLKLARFYVLGKNLEEGRKQLSAALKLLPNEPGAHTLAATISLREGDMPGARASLDKAMALAPGSAEVAIVDVSYLRLTAGNAAAVARADEALTLHPKDLGLYLLKAQILEQMGDQTAVGTHLEAMVAAFPENPEFRRARARWAVQNDDMETAEEELRAIATALPDNREAIVTLIRFLNQQRGEMAARTELAAQIERSSDPFPLELMLVQFDVDTGQIDAAIAYLREMVEREGENTNQARIALARLLVRQRQTADAYALIDAVLQEDAKNVDALVIHIARLIDAEKLDEALQAVRTGLSEAPDDVRVLVLAGRTQEMAGNLDLASDRLAKAVRVSEYDPTQVERYVRFLFRANRSASAETVLVEATERHPKNTTLTDMLVSIRIQQEDWTGAEIELAKLAKLDEARARQLRGALLIGQERFDEGAALLREDLPDDERQQAASISALIQTYIRDGKLEEAKQFLSELLENNPDNLQARGILGNIHLSEGDLTTAEAAYLAILDIDSGNAGAHSALARLQQLQGNSDKAEQALRQGLDASPENVLLRTRLAQLMEARGAFDEAIDLYGMIYTQIPDSLLIANNLSSLLSDHYPDDQARLDRAYAIAGRLRNSTLPQYRDTYGWTRYLKGEYEEAERYILPVLEILPNNPWVNYHAGMVHAALKKSESAQRYLRKALELAGQENIDFPPRTSIQTTLSELSP